MTNWTRLVTVRELGRRRKLRVEVGDTAVALFQADDGSTPFATCASIRIGHWRKAPCCTGGSSAPVTSGRSTSTPATRRTRTCCQPTYAVKVEDDVVYVDLTRSPDYAETATSPAEVD